MKKDTTDTSKNKKHIKPTNKKTHPSKKSLSPRIIKKTIKTKTKDAAHHIKPADKKLKKENAARYRSMIEIIDNGYFEVDLAGNFTFFNDEVCRTIGYSRKELMRQNYRHHTDKETAKIVFQTYNKVYRTGKPIKEFGYNIIRKDGTKRYVESSVSLLKNSSDKPIGFRGILHDITEQKLIEERLLFKKQRFRAFIDHSLDITVIMNREGIITYINPAVEKVLGYKVEKGLAQKDLSMFIRMI